MLQRWVHFLDCSGDDSMVPFGNGLNFDQAHELASKLAQEQRSRYPELARRVYQILMGPSVDDVKIIATARTIEIG